MRIFIDEAGPFLPPTSTPSSYSLVMALVIPNFCEKELYYEFLRLRDSWPTQQIEIKGSSLDEKQAAQIIDLLTLYDVIVDFVALDMSFHTKDAVDDFKSRQAEAITKHITREHHGQMVFELVGIEKAIRGMPNQLFIQAEATIDLILKVLQLAMLYYVQRQPAELGDIAWIVDRKGHTLTEMEELWSTLILPMSENHFMKTPLVSIRGFDYSYFEKRYETDPGTDEVMARHLEWVSKIYKGGKEVDLTRPVINSRLVFTEQLQFLDSKDSLGLQLADMLASTLRRALNDHLQELGWKNFGKLVVNARKPGWIIRLGEGPEQPSCWPRCVERVWNALKSKSKSMVLD